MTLRAAGKLIWFFAQIIVNVGDYVFRTAFVSPKNKRAARAAWLHRATRRHLKIFNLKPAVSGPIPARGLIVSNHLSYLDILVLASVAPAAFVSKADVRGWPMFGWLATLGGTVFIERERRTHVGAVNREVERALADGVPVVVFPEGTSSAGANILPFRSSLLEPAIGGTHAISVNRSGSNPNKLSLPDASRCTIPAPSRTRRCFVTACLVSFVPRVSSAIEHDRPRLSSVTRPSRVASPNAAKTIARCCRHWPTRRRSRTISIAFWKI